MVLKVRIWLTSVIYNTSKKRRSDVICQWKIPEAPEDFRVFYDVILQNPRVVLDMFSFRKIFFGQPFTVNFLAWFLEILVLSMNILQVLLANFLDVCPFSKCPRKISRNVTMSTSKQEFSKIMSHSAHLVANVRVSLSVKGVLKWHCKVPL